MFWLLSISNYLSCITNFFSRFLVWIFRLLSFCTLNSFLMRPCYIILYYYYIFFCLPNLKVLCCCRPNPSGWKELQIHYIYLFFHKMFKSFTTLPFLFNRLICAEKHSTDFSTSTHNFSLFQYTASYSKFYLSYNLNVFAIRTLDFEANKRF